MREVIPRRLWLGHALDGRDFTRLFDRGVEAIVDLAREERPEPPPRDFLWLRYPLIDGSGNSPGLLRLGVVTIARLIEEGVPTLVVCGAGMSRSPALVAAAMARAANIDPDACLRRVVEGSPHDLAPALWRDIKAACFPMPPSVRATQ